MTYFLFPIFASLLWASVNHIDKYLLDKICKNREIGSLVIFSALAALPVVIIAGLLQTQTTVFDISLIVAILVATGGFIQSAAMIPYLHALNTDETSNISPLQVLIPVFGTMLGWIFLNEVLGFFQILAITMILFGSVGLSTSMDGKLKFNYKTISLMLIMTFLISLNALIFKFFAIEDEFIKIIFWQHIGYLIFGVLLFIIKKSYRNQFLELLTTNTSKVLTLNFTNEILVLTGNSIFHYATLFYPLGVVESLTEGAQPIFVLLIGILLTLYFPNIVKENIEKKGLLKKTIFISLMVLGIFLLKPWG